MKRVILRLAPTALAGVIAVIGLVVYPPTGPTTPAPAGESPATSDGLATVGAAASAEGAAGATGPPVTLRSGLLAAQADRARVARPVEVKLPSIGIDAPVIAVGVDDQRLLEVPSATDAGWYRYGSSPGDAGSTVLAAHVDFEGVPGTFFELAQAAPGSSVLVETDDGVVHRYVVETVVLHDKAALPADILFSTDGAEVLHLITCGGVFDAAARTYLGNLVVTARPA